MPNVDEWIEIGRQIRDFYNAPEGLQRKYGEFDIPELSNWLAHWREEGHDIEWIKQAIRDDAAGEWRSKHPGEAPRPPQPPIPPIEPSQPTALGWTKIQLTTDSDGQIPAREYSYWPHVARIGDVVYALRCASDGHPQFYRIHSNGSVTNLGPLIGYTGEGEGWYFDRQARVYVIQGPRLHCVNPFNGEDEVVLDISDRYTDHNLWQAHSSDDGLTHCATVRQNSNDFNPHIATVISSHGVVQYVPAFGKQDESHITGSGGHCVIEEDDNNRIVDVNTGREELIVDADGALSHIDCGPDYMVGEDNIHGRAWRIYLPSQRRVELEQTWGMGHVSVQNGKCLLSNASSLMWMDLNGGGLTHILDHGMVPGPGDAYDYQVKANMDATASVGLYMTNHGGGSSHQDVIVVNLSRPLSVRQKIGTPVSLRNRR